MKVSIIGTGRVGSTLAYTLLLKEFVNELVLVNRTPEVAEGHARDLEHALMFVDHRVQVRAGGVAETAGSDVLAICASRPWRDDFTNRLDLAVENTRLMEELLPPLAEASPDAKIVMLTNPVDVLTWHAIRITGFEPRRVMGTGTVIDSARFREAVSQQVGIHPADIRAYAMGEHGESQFLAFSRASVGGEPLEDRPDRREMFSQAVRAGLEVFNLKGCTEFAISMAAAHVIESILTDSRHTMPLSVSVDGSGSWGEAYGLSGVCLSLPVVIGREGIVRWLKPELDEEEIAALQHSAGVIRVAIVGTLNP